MSMSNYRVFSENPYPLVQEESIPAISFLDDCGKQFFDKETVQSLLKAKDKQFQQKCFARVREIMEDENVTVLFVTHSSSAAQEFCTRGIVLDKGTKKFDGSIQDAIAFYESHE